MRYLLIISTFLLFCNLQAQQLTHRPGYMIIQVVKDGLMPDILSDHSQWLRSPITVDRVLSKRLGIYLLAFDHARIHEKDFLDQLRSDTRVSVAQFDHLTKNRNTPNDPQFSEQWQWLNEGQTGGLVDSDTDVDLAWNITQGGVTIKGDTIVVAIIDDGINFNHPDIAANMWINHGEIRDNGIDDDGNGYVDDVHGWNAYNENPNVFRIGHGLAVAGMIGAVGNNGIGIAGINWHVKLMAIVGGAPESAAIAAYAYALDQRILYHETGGEKGAFVVSTNSSWGIDEGQPADAPLWCAFYDSLGMHGILSAAATANNNDDIDIVGDLPTACTSEFLLSVTALNDANERTFSAFGLEHVDFGAPGENVFTTQGGDEYGNTSGTSFASPVAAGLVALLYSAPCLGIADLAHTDPAGAARYIRDLIFNGVEKITELEDETKYGGALNAGNSMSLLMALCSECPIPFGITSTPISEFAESFDWSTIEMPDQINARYKPISAIEWDTLFDVSAPLILSNLLACTDYEIEFESVCSDTVTGFQSHYEFKTEGCCELPSNIDIEVNENDVHLSWSHVFAAEYYLIQWRELGQSEWMEVVTSFEEITIDLLRTCTSYEFRLQTNCDTSLTGFSDIIQVRTKNCGTCIDLTYCEAGSDNSSDEFIDSLQIGPLINHSGQNGGYALFEDFQPQYIAGQTYDVMLRPGFDFNSFDEQFRIWLDANQDGVFDEEELILDTILLKEDPSLISEITIPGDALAGSTRMRVSMSFFDLPNNVDQEPCGIIQFGEVEDYCINIIRNDNDCPRVDTVIFEDITFTGATIIWDSVPSAIAYTYRYREVGETDYTEMATNDTSATINDLSKCSMYEIQVRTICLTDTTAYDSVYILTTDCDVAVSEPNPPVSSFNVYPNPFTDFVTIEFEADQSGLHTISLFNLQGQMIESKSMTPAIAAKTKLQFDRLSEYPPGLFVVVIENNRSRSMKKIIKM